MQLSLRLIAPQWRRPIKGVINASVCVCKCVCVFGCGLEDVHFQAQTFLLKLLLLSVLNKNSRQFKTWIFVYGTKVKMSTQHSRGSEFVFGVFLPRAGSDHIREKDGLWSVLVWALHHGGQEAGSGADSQRALGQVRTQLLLQVSS